MKGGRGERRIRKNKLWSKWIIEELPLMKFSHLDLERTKSDLIQRERVLNQNHLKVLNPFYFSERKLFLFVKLLRA